MSALDAIVLPVGDVLHPAAEIESREERFGGIGGAICPRHGRWCCRKIANGQNTDATDHTEPTRIRRSVREGPSQRTDASLLCCSIKKGQSI